MKLTDYNTIPKAQTKRMREEKQDPSWNIDKIALEH